MKEEEVVTDKSLQYEIVMEKVRRGVLVTIGCERFIFHENETKHMAKVISEYVKDYSTVREYCEINIEYCGIDTGSLGEYTQDEETILSGFDYFEKLCVEIGLVGYRLTFIQQGEENDMYFSNITDLSDKLYSLIVEYKRYDTLPVGRGYWYSTKAVDTPPPIGAVTMDVARESSEMEDIKWGPATGKGE